jgi:hypothetical protein
MAEEQFWFIDDNGETQGPFGKENMELWRPWFEPKSTLVFRGGSPPSIEECILFRPYNELFPPAPSTEESSMPSNGSKDKCTAEVIPVQQYFEGRASADIVLESEEKTTEILNEHPFEENIDLVIDRENSQQRRRRKLRSHLKLVDILTRAQKQNAQSSRLENDLRTLEKDARALKLARRKNIELDEKFRKIGVEYGKVSRNEGLGARGSPLSKPKQSARPVTIFELPENFAAAELRGLASATGTERGVNAIARKDDRASSFLARKTRKDKADL